MRKTPCLASCVLLFSRAGSVLSAGNVLTAAVEPLRAAASSRGRALRTHVGPANVALGMPLSAMSMPSAVLPEFDLRRASEAARLAQLAYASSTPAVSRGLERLGIGLVDAFSGDGGTFAVLGRRDNSLAVVFRGTANAENVAVNLACELEPLARCGVRDAPDSCLVHAGFSRAYAGVGPQLVAALRALAADHPDGAPALSISIVGHSLGGALAALCAVHLASEVEASLPGCSGLAFKSVEGFTFGTGRLGNEAFARYFRQRACGASARPRSLCGAVPRFRFWSLAHSADMLALMPPRALGYADHCSSHVLACGEERDGLGRGGPHSAWLHAQKPAWAETAAAAAAHGLIDNLRVWAQKAWGTASTLMADPMHLHRIATYVDSLAAATTGHQSQRAGTSGIRRGAMSRGALQTNAPRSAVVPG